MRVSLRKTQHKIFLLLAIVVIAALAAHAIWGPYGLLHLRYLEGQQAQLEKQLFRLHQENEELRAHLERLESDDLYLEQVVRERLGFVGPNEILLEFATPTPTATP
ncbi:MAG: septum formation initiator family protein [Candidatus Binatia bacterium]|nr:septum formation initiator family protein [Candidatus Binatia bacterium]